MAFTAGYEAILLVAGVQIPCELSSDVNLDRGFEKVICKQNAPGGEVSLQDYEGTMNFSGAIENPSVSGDGFTMAQRLKDGTAVTAAFQAGGGTITFPVAYVTNVTLEGEAEGNTATYGGTLTLSGAFTVT